jgi:predicted O-linked N-acetylglucosamine transferase (SPINDLY family)
MVDRLTFLPREIEDCVEEIRSQRMDMLIFPTNLAVGAGFYETLAAYRMAPVQIVETCCPVTTGLKNIDYYLSGSFTEPPDAAEFYSEELVMVEGPAQAYCFFPEEPELSKYKKWNRAALGIPEDAIVFISGANANKIIPELRLLWARILAAVPGSYMVLYPFNRNWQAEYPVSYFMRSLLRSGDQCGVDGKCWKVLTHPLESREELLAMIGNADVYLDSMRHSGAVSMLDPLLLGIPPVVIDGCYGRGRQSAAILRSLELDSYICQTEDDYFDMAVKLGKQRNERLLFAGQIRERMAKNPQIFDCRRYAREVERVLMQVAKNHSLSQ